MTAPSHSAARTRARLDAAARRGRAPGGLVQARLHGPALGRDQPPSELLQARRARPDEHGVPGRERDRVVAVRGDEVAVGAPCEPRETGDGPVRRPETGRGQGRLRGDRHVTDGLGVVGGRERELDRGRHVAARREQPGLALAQLVVEQPEVGTLRLPALLEHVLGGGEVAGERGRLHEVRHRPHQVHGGQLLHRRDRLPQEPARRLHAPARQLALPERERPQAVGRHVPAHQGGRVLLLGDGMGLPEAPADAMGERQVGDEQGGGVEVDELIGRHGRLRRAVLDEPQAARRPGVGLLGAARHRRGGAGHDQRPELRHRRRRRIGEHPFGRGAGIVDLAVQQQHPGPGGLDERLAALGQDRVLGHHVLEPAHRGGRADRATAEEEHVEGAAEQLRLRLDVVVGELDAHECGVGVIDAPLPGERHPEQVVVGP